MQNSATAKTKWAPKHRFLVVGGAAAAAAVLFVGITLWLQRDVPKPLAAGTKSYTVDIADNDAERKQGLSGRKHLGENRGMLFVFPEAGKRCFWMKDMQFSLDMIWLDDQKRVVDLLENVAPETYPHSFCSTKQATYVLELSAGQVKAAGIKTGQTIRF